MFTGIRTLIMCLGFAFTAQIILAHDISATRITLASEGNKVEIRQTTPKATIFDIIDALQDNPKGHTQSAEAALAGMALAWQVTSAGRGCPLIRNAYRNQHHNTAIEFRLLFQCANNNVPDSVRFAWLPYAPSNHFVMFEFVREDGTITQLFERQDLTITLPTD